MNKAGKIAIIAGIGLLGAVTLSSCTASFCSTKDTAHLLYSYDPGVTAYYKEKGKDTDFRTPLVITYLDDKEEVKQHTVEGVWCNYAYTNSVGLTAAIATAGANGVKTPDYLTLDFFKLLDQNVLLKELSLKGVNPSEVTSDDIFKCTSTWDSTERTIGQYYGHIKFTSDDASNGLWGNYNEIFDITKEETVKIKETQGYEHGLDFVPSNDFVKIYKTTMETYTKNFRTCLATNQGFYGSYGNSEQVLIEGKTYKYGWSKGFFEGLLIWPIGAFIDVLAVGMGSKTMTNGVPQILAILIVTFLIRALLLAATFKSSTASNKMTELQPEITKIQNKYPNSQTNKYEKQKMAEDMQKLYKKNGVNPFSALIVAIIQFPIFICVWGALSGSAVLTSGTFLGLNLASSISSVLFNAANWTASGHYAAVTAFFLFLLMSGAQTVAMLLPQWIQKKKNKQVEKLGNNPSAKSQGDKMKWFTYIMLAMIIFMGFSLVSAMGVYWLVGALFSIGQTLITHAVMNRKKKKKDNKGVIDQ